jgi:hypothetical protein
MGRDHGVDVGYVVMTGGWWDEGRYDTEGVGGGGVKTGEKGVRGWWSSRRS